MKSWLFIFIFSITIASFSTRAGGTESKDGHPVFFSKQDGGLVCSRTDTAAVPFHSLLTTSAIRLYQKFVSPHKGNSCLMHPHCSLYGRMAFERYNPVKALVKTSDRLHRCGHDLENYQVVQVNQQLRFSDPLEFDFERESFNENERTDDNMIVLPSVCSRPESPVSSADSLMYNFAFSLQVAGYLDEASIEYRRILSMYPGSPLTHQINLNLFDCYYLQDDYLTAIRWGRQLLENNAGLPYEEQLKYRVGVAYLKSGNNEMARRCFAEICESRSSYADEAQILRGLSFAYQFQWRDAVDQFSRLDSTSGFYKNALGCIRICQQGSSLSYKSPTLAGILGIVPGLGYLYDGFGETAFSSFLINGLFFWGTYEAIDGDHYGLGALLGVFSFGWYSGSIYGSIVSAKRRNVYLENATLLQLDVGFRF